MCTHVLRQKQTKKFWVPRRHIQHAVTAIAGQTDIGGMPQIPQSEMALGALPIMYLSFVRKTFFSEKNFATESS
jgi:hypothetical protein